MRARGDSGFTLVETLVALTIFALAAGAFYQGLGLGFRGIRASRIDTAALALAKVQLASVGVESPLAEGTTGGATGDGFAWTTDVRRYVRDGALDFKPDADAYWVSVRIDWREAPARRTQSLELRTIKLATAP